jgi:hypothetical protein
MGRSVAVSIDSGSHRFEPSGINVGAPLRCWPKTSSNSKQLTTGDGQSAGHHRWAKGLESPRQYPVLPSAKNRGRVTLANWYTSRRCRQTPRCLGPGGDCGGVANAANAIDSAKAGSHPVKPSERLPGFDWRLLRTADHHWLIQGQGPIVGGEPVRGVAIGRSQASAGCR